MCEREGDAQRDRDSEQTKERESEKESVCVPIYGCVCAVCVDVCRCVTCLCECVNERKKASERVSGCVSGRWVGRSVGE